MRSGLTGKSLKYYKSGKLFGIQCPFCELRVSSDLDLHMTLRHPDFWWVVCAYQEVRAWMWPR